MLDTAFIGEHTAGFDAFADDLRNESWSALTAESGVPYEQIDSLAQLYARSERVIATWGMGITQHKHSVATVQMLTNLMLMRGNIGRPGAGLCPVRGHSNVQGNRTVGIEENRRRHSSTGSATCSTSNRRATTATTSSRRSKGCSKAT